MNSDCFKFFQYSKLHLILKATFFLIFCTNFKCLHAQKVCGTIPFPQAIYDEFTGLKKIERDYRFAMISAIKDTTIVPGKIVIPVIVHVVYNEKNEKEEDIPNNIIAQQIQKLNDDFSGSNADRNLIPLYFRVFDTIKEISSFVWVIS